MVTAAMPTKKPALRFRTWSQLLTGIYFRPEDDGVSVGHQQLLSVGGVRTVLGEKALDRHHASRLQKVFLEAAPEQRVGRSGLEAPIRHLAVGVFDVQIDPRVWIRHIEFGHGSRHLDGLGT